MLKKVEKMIRERDIMIPSLLFYNYRELGINAEDVLLLTYLMNGDISFNPKKISNELNLELSELMEQIEHLKSKNLVTIELKKIGDKRMELINLDGFYDKLIGFIFEQREEDSIEETIYDIFEREFGRTLSPMEYEIINAWQESNYSKETIILALKEAVYNGVNNLRYIDRILSEWSKKGIKTQEDLDKDKEKFIKKKNQAARNIENTDYDWLNDEE